MYEGQRWLLLDSIGSLTLPRVGRTSGAKKFRSSARRDFFDSTGTNAKVPRRPQYFRYGGKVEAARTSFVIDPSRTSANNGDGGWQSTGNRIATRLGGNMRLHDCGWPFGATRYTQPRTSRNLRSMKRDVLLHQKG